MLSQSGYIKLLGTLYATWHWYHASLKNVLLYDVVYRFIYCAFRNVNKDILKYLPCAVMIQYSTVLLKFVQVSVARPATCLKSCYLICWSSAFLCQQLPGYFNMQKATFIGVNLQALDNCAALNNDRMFMSCLSQAYRDRSWRTLQLMTSCAKCLQCQNQSRRTRRTRFQAYLKP